MSTPTENTVPTPDDDKHEVVTDINEELVDTPAATAVNKEESEDEKSMLKKVSEIGEDAFTKLKGVLAEVDKEELKKSVNPENIKRSIASTLDGFNAKVQTLLATKGENRENDADSGRIKTEDKL